MKTNKTNNPEPNDGKLETETRMPWPESYFHPDPRPTAVPLHDLSVNYPYTAGVLPANRRTPPKKDRS